MKLVLVVCLHGNEKYGLDVARYFQGNIPSFIGNPEAVVKNMRFINSDLNRIFPGKKGGNVEEKRAFYLTDELKNYDYVLDLHSSSNNCPLFGIITQPNEEKINFAKNLGLKKIVLMPDSFASGKALIDFCRCGISLEVGPHGRKENSDEVIGLIDNFLGENIYKEDMIVFEIFKIIKQKYKNIKIKNFEKVEKNQMLTQDETGAQFAEEEFVPVLVGEKAYHGILCLAARKVNLKDR